MRFNAFTGSDGALGFPFALPLFQLRIAISGLPRSREARFVEYERIHARVPDIMRVVVRDGRVEAATFRPEGAAVGEERPLPQDDAAWKLATPLRDDYGVLAKVMWARTFSVEGPAACYL